MSNGKEQVREYAALEDIQAIRDVAGDVDEGLIFVSAEKTTIRGNIGGIVMRACDRLEYRFNKLRDSLEMANRLLEKSIKRESVASHLRRIIEIAIMPIEAYAGGHTQKNAMMQVEAEKALSYIEDATQNRDEVVR